MSRAHRPSPCCNRRSRAVRIDLERGFMLAACAICGKEFVSRLQGGAAQLPQARAIAAWEAVVETDQGIVLGRALDRIENKSRTDAMTACLEILQRFPRRSGPQKPPRPAHANVIELFPRRTP